MNRTDYPDEHYAPTTPAADRAVVADSVRTNLLDMNHAQETAYHGLPDSERGKMASLSKDDMSRQLNNAPSASAPSVDDIGRSLHWANRSVWRTLRMASVEALSKQPISFIDKYLDLYRDAHRLIDHDRITQDTRNKLTSYADSVGSGSIDLEHFRSLIDEAKRSIPTTGQRFTAFKDRQKQSIAESFARNKHVFMHPHQHAKIFYHANKHQIPSVMRGIALGLAVLMIILLIMVMVQTGGHTVAKTAWVLFGLPAGLGALAYLVLAAHEAWAARKASKAN